VDICGNTIINGTLDVSGNTTLNGTLDVSEKSTFYKDVDICGNSVINGTLDVSGNTTLNGTLDVSEKSTFYKDVDICGNSLINGTLGVTGDTTLNGTLDVSGLSTFYNDVDICGNLTVNGCSITNIYDNRIEIDSNYTALSGIYLIATTPLSIAITITLPAPSQGNQYLIVNESGDATTYSITINPPSGKTISGHSSFILNTNYSTVYLYSTSSNYFISSTLP
jgi:hypothetical protein